jgi:hypothetical protein
MAKPDKPTLTWAYAVRPREDRLERMTPREFDAEHGVIPRARPVARRRRWYDHDWRNVR